ncbi:hypothetical protein PCL_09919 [Purpureocillium lilacinum]|uniref:Uncharacterized protein n=1 Tax=Purpureocillium lilacinum TaxID=33203 RepID=A0A2U3EEF8_PURLI|nr:hypothetical protein Purlil1_1055 [Purpureocillium lilacinum]PWI72904.1 hypothetical protein PCL_09919 [Purpureocillium lilacinum]
MPPPPATPLCLAGGDLRVVRPKSPRPFSTSILLPHCPAFEPPPLPVPTTTRLETSSTTDLPMAAPRNSLPPPGTLALRFLTRQPADVSLTGSLTNQGPGAARASKPPRGASCVLPPCDAPARALPFPAHNVPPPAHPHVPFPS